jgi:DNA repair exonuclease SbcCD ATPase subunit
MNLIKTRKKVNNLLSDLNVAKRACKEQRRKLAKAERQLISIKEAQQIVQQVAKEIQQKAHKQIAGVVSRCLEAVFYDENYGFEIDFVRKRNRTEAILILTKNGHRVEDPLNADSGGVCDVAAFALRTACIILTKPNLRRFLSLDEPFKFVSPEYRNNVRLLLEGLAKDFDFQYLMVTHEKEYHIGKVIEL